MKIMLSGDFDLCEKCNLEPTIWFRSPLAAGADWGFDRPAQTYQVGGAEEYTTLCLSCFEAAVIGSEAKKEWQQKRTSASEADA